MKLYEIFYSLQGEGLSAGQPTIFVRFSGCNLRCTYCDTKYAYRGGRELTWESVSTEIVEAKWKYNCHRICFTGGEPLLQKNIWPLIRNISRRCNELYIETNGSVKLPVERIRGVYYVLDYKLPESKQERKMRLSNWDVLDQGDVVKFVVASKKDFNRAWKILKCKRYGNQNYTPIFSPVFGKVTPLELAQWILTSREDFRMQIQLHKLIWDPKKRGV